MESGGERQALSHGAAISIIVIQSIVPGSSAQNPVVITTSSPKEEEFEGLTKHRTITNISEPQDRVLLPESVKTRRNKWPQTTGELGQAGSNQERMKPQQLA